MPRRNRKKVHLGVRVSPALRDAIEAARLRYGVSQTDVVVGALRDRMVAEGFLQEDDDEDGRQARKPELAAGTRH